MKRCSMCGETKPFEDFMWNNRAQNKRDSYCRPCRAIYKREHYRKNKARYIANASAWNQRNYSVRMRKILDHLRSHPCVDCGETDPAVLEFDHLRDKKFNVMEGAYSRNWDDVLAEIEKCEVRCANCHRRETAIRGRWVRVLLTGWRTLHVAF